MATLEPPPLPDFLARELPFRRVIVPTAEGRIHAIDDGPRDAPTVFLLHGNPRGR